MFYIINYFKTRLSMKAHSFLREKYAMAKKQKKIITFNKDVQIY